MPTSTTFLPDVNVWVALASRRHIHAAVCARWLSSIDTGQVVFCRVTQMGLLRLLTHQAVMGSDTLSSREAWRVYRTMLADERIVFASEPFGVEQIWQRLTMLEHSAPKVWTDGYLIAFARAAGMRLVTLDRAVLQAASEALLLT